MKVKQANSKDTSSEQAPSRILPRPRTSAAIRSSVASSASTTSTGRKGTPSAATTGAATAAIAKTFSTGRGPPLVAKSRGAKTPSGPNSPTEVVDGVSNAKNANKKIKETKTKKEAGGENETEWSDTNGAEDTKLMEPLPVLRQRVHIIPRENEKKSLPPEQASTSNSMAKELVPAPAASITKSTEDEVIPRQSSGSSSPRARRTFVGFLAPKQDDSSQLYTGASDSGPSPSLMPPARHIQAAEDQSGERRGRKLPPSQKDLRGALNIDDLLPADEGVDMSPPSSGEEKHAENPPRTNAVPTFGLGRNAPNTRSSSNSTSSSTSNSKSNSKTSNGSTKQRQFVKAVPQDRLSILSSLEQHQHQEQVAYGVDRAKKDSSTSKAKDNASAGSLSDSSTSQVDQQIADELDDSFAPLDNSPDSVLSSPVKLPMSAADLIHHARPSGVALPSSTVISRQSVAAEHGLHVLDHDHGMQKVHQTREVLEGRRPRTDSDLRSMLTGRAGGGGGRVIIDRNVGGNPTNPVLVPRSSTNLADFVKSNYDPRGVGIGRGGEEPTSL
ncbi:unnamed protein product [Amoebophrya sp. A25]|nr:unnamed protein product [Amoebophrya sp. A25]|eukprot:GSA25T00004781001.1